MYVLYLRKYIFLLHILCSSFQKTSLSRNYNDIKKCVTVPKLFHKMKFLMDMFLFLLIFLKTEHKGKLNDMKPKLQVTICL